MCDLSGCVAFPPCHRNEFESVCLVPVIVLVVVLLPLSQSLVNLPLLWERQITSHDGFTVCGDEKQKLLLSCRQGCPWDCVDCTISLTKASSTPQWCCHGACFFGSTNTTPFSMVENRFHPAEIHVLSFFTLAGPGFEPSQTLEMFVVRFTLWMELFFWVHRERFDLSAWSMLACAVALHSAVLVD